MNASQRRTVRRSVIRTMHAVGIVPGITVERKAPGKSTATPATVELITFPFGNPRRPILQVRRRDKHVTEWPLREVAVMSLPKAAQHAIANGLA